MCENNGTNVCNVLYRGPDRLRNHTGLVSSDSGLRAQESVARCLTFPASLHILITVLHSTPHPLPITSVSQRREMFVLVGRSSSITIQAGDPGCMVERSGFADRSLTCGASSACSHALTISNSKIKNLFFKYARH